MGSQPPYRMPCEAVAGKPRYFFGGSFQHALAPLLSDKYINSTQVPDYASPGMREPYERWHPNPDNPVECPSACCSDTPGADCVGAVPCSPWEKPFTANTFVKEGQIDFAKGHKTGWKGVQARKYWQGVFGFAERETCEGPDTVTGCGLVSAPAPPIVKYRSAQVGQFGKGPSRVRYLKASVTSIYTLTTWDYSSGSGVSTVTTDTLKFTQTIDQNSGLLDIEIQSAVGSNSGALSNPQDPGGDDTTNDEPAGQIYFWNWDQIVNRMTGLISSGDTFIYQGNSATVTALIAGVQQTIEQLNWQIGSSSMTADRTVYDYIGGVNQVTGFTENVSVSDAQFEYSNTEYGYNSDGTISAQVDVTIAVTLSNPYKDSDVYEEIVSLLDKWDLTDDEQYPWRGDDRMSVAPLVSRDEKLTQNWLNDFWVKDYGSPIANPPPSGAQMPDQHWLGTCNIIGSPDPDTGNAVVSIQLGPYDISAGPVIISGKLDNPFLQGTLQPVTIRGVNNGNNGFPPGVNVTVNPDNTISWEGQVSASGYWGVTFICTCSIPNYSGGVLGAPTQAGHQNFFDFGFQDWRGCCSTDDTGDTSFIWYLRGHGMFLDDFNGVSRAQLPETATQWTNWFQAANKPPAAWLFYNDRGSYFPPGCINSDDSPSGVLDTNALWACKYAEILDLWPSQNFARPGGNDKFSYDETRVYCASPGSAGVPPANWIITDSFGNTPPDGTDFSGIWGGASVGGFYNVAGYSGGVLTLGAKVYNVPSDWSSASGDTAACFGKLRFPDAPSLLGRVPVTKDPNDQSGFTLEYVGAYQPQFGMSAAPATVGNETLDIWDNKMNLIAGGVTATRKDDYSFTTALAYPNAFFVTVTGAPKSYMNDSDPKGDYAFLQWNSDFRTAGIPNGIDTPLGEYNRVNGITDCNGNPVGPLPANNAGGGPVENPYAFFSQTPGCVPFIPCGPKVVCISPKSPRFPNGEQFPGGVTYTFPDMLDAAKSPSDDPGKFYFDQYYGSKWWAWIQVTMTDLLWQAPHRPCNLPNPASTGWKMDDVSCREDDDATHWYAYHPQVEARLAVPCNYGTNQNECAGAPPEDVQLGWLSPVQYTFGAGDVAFPPLPGFAPDGSPGGAGTAFLLHSTFCIITAAGGCRFNYSVPGC